MTCMQMQEVWPHQTVLVPSGERAWDPDLRGEALASQLLLLLLDSEWGLGLGLRPLRRGHKLGVLGPGLGID